MSTEQILLWATLLTAVAAFGGVVAAYLQYRRQCNVQVFLEYTKRYSAIMESFPSDSRRARLNLNSELPPESIELTLAVLRYLNLCSEEFYLWKRGYLATSVWRIWEDELKRTLQSPLVRREWEDLSSEFGSYEEYVAYVTRAQAG